MPRKQIYSVTLDKHKVDTINKENYWDQSFSKLVNHLLDEFIEKKKKEKVDRLYEVK